MTSTRFDGHRLYRFTTNMIKAKASNAAATIAAPTYSDRFDGSSGNCPSGGSDPSGGRADGRNEAAGMGNSARSKGVGEEPTSQAAATSDRMSDRAAA